MAKMNVDLDSQPALQEVAQITQAVRQLYQLLQSVKGVFSDLGLNSSGAAGFIGGGGGTAAGSAQSSATVGGGLNLAGAFGGAGAGFSLGSILAQQGGINGPSSLNPSIVAAQNQSVAAGMGGANPARYAPDGGISFHPPALSHFEDQMGYTNIYGKKFGGSQYETFQDFKAARSAYQSSVDGAYQGAQLVDTFGRYADQMLNGSPVPGMSGQMYNNLGNLNAQALAQRATQQNQFNYALGSTTVLGASQVAGAYTQSVVNGQQNAMGYGSAYGGTIGGIAGAVIGNLIAPGIGGFAGAALGASLGSSGANALQAPAQARYQAAQTLGGYGAATGQDAMALAGNAGADAARVNAGLYDNTQAGTAGWGERALRLTGLYQGVDQTSTQQMAQTQAAIGGGYLNNGVSLGQNAISAISTRMTDRYGANAPAVAESIARAVGNLNASGGNMTDLALRAGITPTATFLRDRGDNAEADRLVGGLGVYQATQYRATGAASAAQGAAADYDASGFSGLSTRQRSGAFNTMQGASQAQIGAIDSELGALSAMPGGANSNEAKAKRALRSQMLADIAREASNRAGSMLNDASGEGGVALSGANIGLTRANLYGGAGSFAGAGRELVGALDGEAGGIRSAMQDTNLSYSDRLRGQTRLNEIASQRIMVPAQMAGAAMRRNLMGAEVTAGQAGYGYSVASAYGDDNQVGAAAMGGIQAQQGIISAAQAALRDPSLSVEDRAAAQNQITSAQGNQLQMRIGSRDTLLSRISGRASVAQGAAGLALTRASVLGSGNDLRTAAGGLSGAYNDEIKALQGQLDAGGLTVEQEIRTRGQMNSLRSNAFTTDQNAIDAGYAKDDLTGYSTPARRLQGQQDRLQYLPFSASNPIKISLQQISLNKKHLGVLDAREQALKSAGNLSPEREDEIESQRQSLYTQNAAAVSQISEGFINRLPSMSAGATSYSGRLNSYSLAAAQLQMMGSPIMSFGSNGGGQTRTQDDFIRAAGGSPDEINARSTTMGLNNGGGETNALLRRIAEALEKGTGGGNGMRPGENAGNVNSVLNRRDLGQITPSNVHN